MTLEGRAVSSESGETYAACDVSHVGVIDMAVDSYAYSSHSTLAPLHGGGRLHTQRSWTHLYVLSYVIELHPHILSMHKTHPSACAPE